MKRGQQKGRPQAWSLRAFVATVAVVFRPVGTATAVTGQEIKIFLSIMSGLQIFEIFLIQGVLYQAGHSDLKIF